MATTIKFKRGKAEDWENKNIILQEGEPGYVIDENRFKIGDGVTPWKELPYAGESNVVNKQTHYDFPSIGRANTIYKAESEGKIYQWNTSSLRYEVLGSDGDGNSDLNITLINGGNAK